MPWRRGNRLHVLPEELAQGRTLEIYDDIKNALGIPCLPMLFQAYGVFPSFLEMHWRALRPVVETSEFFRLTDRIRADAYTRTHNYFEIPDLSPRLADLKFSEADREELTRLTEVFHYSVAVFVLVATVQMQAFDGRTGQERHSSAAAHPVFEGPLTLVSEKDPPPNIRKVFDEMKRALNVPFLNVPYQAFAHGPRFLELYWELLKEVLHSPIYVECSHGVCDTAWALAREVPHPVELTVSQLIEAGVAEDDVTAIVRITELFVKMLCGVALNVAVAKIGLEGGAGRRYVAQAHLRTAKNPPQGAS
ncbi:MAG: halocarboxylic acid dehydrogenase DehI family protein [Burkholderiales bacterium]